MGRVKTTPRKAVAKKPHGRPSTFRQEVADAICERLSKGEPLAVICRSKGMPPVRTVSQWKADHTDFAADFARARDEGFDAIAAQCMEIADDETHDWVLSQKGEITDEVAIGRAKLRVETRLKLLAKWDPKRYGELVRAELTGKDGKDLPAAPAGVLVVPGLATDPAAWAKLAQGTQTKGE